jgi:hypothetical protein
VLRVYPTTAIEGIELTVEPSLRSSTLGSIVDLG